MVKFALQAAMEAGVIRFAPVEALAHVLLGGLMEAAMLLAASADPRRARAEVGQAVTALIDGLAVPQVGPRSRAAKRR